MKEMPFQLVKPIRGGVPLDEYYLRLASDTSWVCQAKMNGKRALWDPESGVLWSRHGNSITNAVQVVQALSNIALLVDGELIVKDGTAVFYAFDLPDVDATLSERWRALAAVIDSLNAECVKLVPTEVRWDDVKSNAWEGVVFKRRSSRYVKGLTADKTISAWVKYRAEWMGV